MKTYLVDNLNPQDVAMVQALYSRSNAGVESHLQKLAESDSGSFMSKYYLGYGHKSIADCGSVTFFAEGVSILAAKALQDWPLYSGQETSTRYIDMGSQGCVDPLGTEESSSIQKAWIDLYLSLQEPLTKVLVERYPKKPREKEETYLRAIKARGFDILRSLLPAGVKTQLSWHTNLRQAGDHLAHLSYSPLEEVVTLAKTLLAQAQSKYPDTFGFVTKPTISEWEEDAWICASSVPLGFPYYQPETDFAAEIEFNHGLNLYGKQSLLNRLEIRPKGAQIPYHFNVLGDFSAHGLLDYGSWRDLQRHRNGVCQPTLLTLDHGIHPWYLEALGPLREGVQARISELEARIRALDTTEEDRQYYIPLGYRVQYYVRYPIPAAIYVMELRSQKTVHPTLRSEVRAWAKAVAAEAPQIKLFVDWSLDDWDVRRGEQTIKEK